MATTKEITVTEPVTEAVNDPLPEAVEDPNDPCRLVKIKLYKGKNSDKGLYVNVNNHNYFVPRGEVVEVPYYIAAVIENSAAQDENTARLIESFSERASF